MKSLADRCDEPHKIYLHAEVDAILKCKQLDKAHRISIFRTGKKGTYLKAAPCKLCQLAISEANIPNVEHT
jgi:deoxycytidylate deaminase